MRRIIKFWLLQLLALVGCSPDFEDVKYPVVEVIDGNTLVLKNGYLVRLIGIEGTGVSQRELEQMVLNQRVRITFDRTSYPESIESGELVFGYVSLLNGESVNGQLLKKKLSGLNLMKLTDSLAEFQVYTTGTLPIANHITTVSTEAVPQTTLFNEGRTLTVLYENIKPGVFMVLTESKQGSGFFVSRNIGITNYHVIEGDPIGEVSIVTHDQNRLLVKEVIAYSEEDDYIIFRVEDSFKQYPSLKLSATEPKVGEDVFAIGNPQGLEHTLSKGIISSYRKERRLIQTTTEITHGSSGGPLLNMAGEVVGITTSGLGEANINFAVNISLIRESLQ